MVIKTKEGGILDTYDSIKYPFNYSIGDVRDITKRNIDYSKTIKLPASKNNNEYFEMFFNVNVKSGAFNPNEKRYVSVEEDGAEVFAGYLQLMSVVINGDLSYYEAVVFSSFRNILDVIEGVNLNDLDFSEYNHPYEITTFTKTILADVDDRRNYTYYEEYKKANIPTTGNSLMPLGYGYIYPYISYDGTIQSFIDTFGTDLLYPNAYPAFYVREYIDKIFLLAGYKVESKFFDTDYFKSLILPFTNGEMTFSDEEIENSEMIYANSGETFYGRVSDDGGFSIYDFVNDEEVKSANPPINDGNGISFTYNSDATRENVFKGSLKLVFEVSEENIIFTRRKTGQNVLLQIKVNNTIAHTTDLISVSEIPNNIQDLDNLTFEKNFEIELPPEVVVRDGDVISAQIRLVNNFYRVVKFNTPTDVPVNMYITDSSVESKLTTDATLTLGDDLNVSKTLPKIKTTDFLKSIITMFNLYVYPKNEDTMIIETRDEFYNQGDLLFFDDRLDKSKEVRIKTLSEESAKIYEYKFKDSNDYIVKEFKESNDGETYGEKRVITDNQFLTKTQGHTTAFAPTGSIFLNFTKSNPDFDVEDRGEPDLFPVFDSRELKEDVVTSQPTFNDYTYKREKSPPRILFSGKGGYAGATERISYPDFSLNFQAPTSEDWTPYYDLYNLFHKNTIEEVSSPDAKMMTCYLRFKKNELSIQNKLYILGEQWRINKIVDYDANSNESTKVELFKINDKSNYLTAEKVIEQIETKQGQYNDKYNNKFI